MDVSDTYFNYTSNYITLNYSPNYSLYHILLKCTVNIISYNLCYTLHTVINFVIILDKKSKFKVWSIIESIV